MAILRTTLFYIFLFTLFVPQSIQAQSFEAGLRNYEQRDYKKASAIFSEINSPRAALFTAKSYYALRRFDEAENILNDLLETSAPRIYYEAAYTSALVDFQQKQYGFALSKLYRVFKNSEGEELAEQSQELYRQVLNYLTAKQRLRAIEAVNSDEIKYDLVETALGRISYPSLKEVFNQFYSAANEASWIQKVKDIEESITSEAAYKIEYGTDYRSFIPPNGTMYKIGIALPKITTEKPTYEVVRSLFLGARLAARRFNDSHSNAHVYLSFLPTQSGLDEVVEAFAANNGDVIIGPLFSEQAKEMIPLSVEYTIPVIAPLATAKMQSSGSLFYQANSTFAVHGKSMAQFAIKELGLNTFAVIAGQGTNGATSARAFKQKAQALGANVVSFQIKDFQESNYDISSYVKKISSSLTSVDAVYAPFTSSYTPYLVEQLIYAVNTFEDPVTLLGSQKWSEINFSTDIYARSDIYYTTNSYKTGKVSNFQYRYSRTFNVNANKYAVIGYDVTRYLLSRLDEVGNPAALNKAIQKAPFFRGLMKNIYFKRMHVNQAVQILHIGSGGEPVAVSRQS